MQDPSVALALRRASLGDTAFLLELRNDPAVRFSAFSSSPVEPDTHRRWLAGKLADPNTILLIVESSGQRIGQVRFDLDPSSRAAEISIALSSGSRGKRIGRRVLQLAGACAFGEAPIDEIRAHIKPENAASIRAFASAGFSEVGVVEHKGHPCLEMVLRRVRAGTVFPAGPTGAGAGRSGPASR